MPTVDRSNVIAVATEVDIIGVHKVRTREPVHLVEMVVSDSDGEFKIGDITQEWPDKDQSSWQVAYDEKVLTSDGSAVLFDPWFPDGDVSKHWLGNVRFAFFFHYLNFNQPLQTPFGDVAVTDATKRPPRLKFLKYESP